MKKRLLTMIAAVGLSVSMLAGCGSNKAAEQASIDDVLIREHELSTDIEGCDTFTQIVDKLPAGKGYANVKVGDTDVLLVTSYTFDNGDGYMAAIDSEVFAYDADGKIVYLGYVTSGGTAYPLAAGDGKLYSGGNHFVAVSTVEGLKLKDSMQAWVEYDTDGNATYYTSENGADAVKADDSALTAMYDEMFDSEIIEFSTIKQGADAEPKTLMDTADETVTSEVTDTAGATDTSSVDSTPMSGSLPAYVYPGPEQFYSVLYDYIIERFSSHYEKADVSIPLPNILDIDESDKSDIKVYGDFLLYNYNLRDKTLDTASGGSYPGCIHMVSSDSGYEVEYMELVGDGAEFEPTAKQIFGDKYDAFIELIRDDDSSNELRAQIIANYVAANNLDITQYQDYGWEPVTLPDENIDSMYSALD